MSKKFIISENDKRHIMSLYGILSEETTNTISGRLITETSLDAYLLSMYETYTVGIKDVNVSLGYFENDGSGSFKKLYGVKTDEDGNFKFEGVPFRSEYVIFIPETDTFDRLIKKLTIKEGQDLNLGDIKVTPKEGVEYMKPQDVEIEDPCGDYESTLKEFYGKGNEQITSTPNPTDLTEMTKSTLDALTSIITQYFEKYEIDESLLDSTLDCLKVKEVPFKYEIVCNKIIPFVGGVTKYIVLKADVGDINKFLLDCANYNNKTVETDKKIEFDNYDFIKALKLSFDNKIKIFMLVGLSSDENTTNVLNKLNLNQSKVDIINKNYINLFYQVDRSQKEKYYIASEFLDMRTYPSIYIIEATKDPTTNEIRNSIKIIKRIEGVSETPNLLDSLEV